jgi:hypothetical protein
MPLRGSPIMANLHIHENAEPEPVQHWQDVAEVSDSTTDTVFLTQSASPSSSKLSSMDQHSGSQTLLLEDLAELFHENIIAKAYRTASRSLQLGQMTESNPLHLNPHLPGNIPESFPEYVPQDGDAMGRYVFREAQFWTCGFFPGTLHALLERLIRFPQGINLELGKSDVGERPDLPTLRLHVLALCNLWAEPLHSMASRKDTHDLGFMIMPALRTNWELTGNLRSLSSIINAADRALADIATNHAATLLRTHLRPESAIPVSGSLFKGQWYSSYHVANLDPATGEIKKSFAAQGYSDDSTWARGQAWGILGYAQTYMWTKDERFLQASCGLAEYFLYRLATGPAWIDSADCSSKPTYLSSNHHGGQVCTLMGFRCTI